MGNEMPTNQERQEAYEKGKLDGKIGKDSNSYYQDLIDRIAGAYSKKKEELSEYYRKGREDGKKER